ncbi:DUF3667 domain-containing protein [uncultured Croceitalea sp.]|uniref:DUF3667 domain-containing protein n=1 Tax=uncultured Croceitalea sp. TaxID=1798908 RepID=UPI0033055BF2
MANKKKTTSLISKGRYELKFRGTECLNCGHILDVSDKYCPNCSQANSTKKLVLKDFFDEFFSSLINYDSKLLNTLYTMLIKPGTITKDYIRGKRMSYTNPFRFLLSLAFLYFLMVTYSNRFESFNDLRLNEKIDESNFSLSMDTDELLEKDSIQTGGQLKKVFADLDSLRTSDPEIAKGLKGLDSIQYYINENARLEREADSLKLANPKLYFSKLQSDPDSNEFLKKVEFFFEMLRKDSISTFDEAREKYQAQNTWSNRMAFNGSKSGLKVIEQPGTWVNDTISRLPFVIFFFLPVFTIFLLVVYIRKKYTYTDHLIFSFHNQSLLFILLILSWIIDTLLNWSTAGLFLTVFSVYLFQAMRKFYGQGVFKTIVKYLFLNSVFAFLALITIILLFTGSIFTY